MKNILKTKILLTGASGVGKTTLVKKFLKDYPEFFNPEPFTRLMIEKKKYWPTNEDTTNETQFSVTAFMDWNILKYDPIIYDRSLIDALAYTKLSSNISEEQYLNHLRVFKDTIERKDVIHFYIPIENKVEDDGVRSLDEDYRLETDKFMLDYLKSNNIEYYELRGTTEERYLKMIEKLVEINK